MAEVRVRNLDDEVVGAFKDRAKRRGHSLEAELRELLTREAFRPRQELADQLDAFSESLAVKYGTLPDSVPSIRDERDRRG